MGILFGVFMALFCFVIGFYLIYRFVASRMSHGRRPP